MVRNYYDLSKLTAVVVDDQAFMVGTIVRVLKSFGMKEMRGVITVEEAVEALEHLKPDMLITDLAMGRVDGMELIRRLRDGKIDCDPEMPIILLTAYSEIDHVKAARELRVSAYLVKPFTPQALYEHIVSLIERPLPHAQATT